MINQDKKKKKKKKEFYSYEQYTYIFFILLSQMKCFNNMFNAIFWEDRNFWTFLMEQKCRNFKSSV